MLRNRHCELNTYASSPYLSCCIIGIVRTVPDTSALRTRHICAAYQVACTLQCAICIMHTCMRINGDYVHVCMCAPFVFTPSALCTAEARNIPHRDAAYMPHTCRMQCARHRCCRFLLRLLHLMKSKQHLKQKLVTSYYSRLTGNCTFDQCRNLGMQVSVTE